MTPHRMNPSIGDVLAAEVGDRVALALHREARLPHAAVFERGRQAVNEAQRRLPRDDPRRYLCLDQDVPPGGSCPTCGASTRWADVAPHRLIADPTPPRPDLGGSALLYGSEFPAPPRAGV